MGAWVTLRLSLLVGLFIIVTPLSLPTGEPPRPSAIAVVPPGFAVEVVATGFPLPSALDFGRGGEFGTDLFVGDWSDGSVYRVVTSTGARSVLTDGVPNPGVIAFGPGGAFSQGLYVATSAGTIEVVDSAGSKTLFTSVQTPFPRDMAFDRLGRFGGDLFVMDTAGGVPPLGDKILRVHPDGSTSVFATTPAIPEENAWGIAIGTEPFGANISVSFGRWSAGIPGRPSLWMLDPSGRGTLFAEVPEFEELTDIVFSDEGPFGRFLYVADVAHDTIYRVDVSGTVEVFATGFQFTSQVSADMVFGPDGALYIAEDGTGSILRIRPESAGTGMADCDPDTINVRSRGRWITCYLEPGASRSAAEIHDVTVRLDSWLAPILDARYGFVFDPEGYLVDHDGNGVLERLFKFDRQRLSSSLTVGNHVFLVEGQYTDGSTFSLESDIIRVVR